MADVLLPPPGQGEPGAPPVTICCATADELPVCQAADALEARGHQVQLAIGVEADQTVLTNAVAARHGQGLYVLCRSGALDRRAVDELREVLRAHDVPFGRTLTLAVDPSRARELEERIVSVLRRMVTGRADNRARAWGSSVPAAEDDPETTVRQPKAEPHNDPMAALAGLGPPPENADPFASTSQIEVMDESEPGLPPPYTGADHTAVSIQAPTPAVPSGSLPGLGAASPASSITMPGAGGSSPITIPGTDQPSSPITIPGSDQPSSPITIPSPDAEPVSSDASSAPVVAPSMPGVPDPMAAHHHPLGVPGADESSTDFEPPLTMGGRMGRALGSPKGLAAVLGGLSLVVLVIVAVNVLGDDEADDAQAARSTASEDKDGDKAKADEAKADEAKADEAKADEAKADEAKADEANESESKAANDGAEAEDGQAEAGADASPAGDDAESPAPEAAEPTPEPTPAARVAAPGEDPPEVVQALRNRDVRALDTFLVAPERKGALTYQQADEYCSSLEVAGLGQWRVPAIGELNSVATARMLGKNIYWSSTFGDAFGDLMLVLNTKKDRISVVGATWDGGRIVCIRPRRP